MSTLSLLEKAIALPFTVGANGSVDFAISEEKIWADRIISALLTRKGERVRRNQYGTSIAAVSLSTMTDAQEEIRKEVTDIFRVLLAPLTLSAVTFNVEPDSSTIDVTISYWLPSADREADFEAEVTIAGFAAVTADGVYYEERR